MENEFEYIAGSLEKEMEYIKEIKQICKKGRAWYNCMKEAGWDEEQAIAMGTCSIFKATGWDR